jgi:putative membrane protein insertion efficiency factor
MRKLKTKLAISLLFILTSVTVFSQSYKSDFSLLRETTFEKYQFQKQKTSFMWVQSSNVVLKYNPVSLGFGSLMYLYQRVLSRHFSANCLYSPSCSQYGRSLIKEYGLVEGILLSSDRVMRCNRIAAIDIPAGFIDEKDHKVHETTDLYR